MSIDFFAVFMIGLLGGFSHCTGMCGGFVMTYSLKIAEKESSIKTSWLKKLTPHLLYNSGRLLSYTILGEVFGFIGGTISVVMSIRDFQGALQLLAGVFMVIIGAELAGWLPAKSRDYFPGLNAFKNLVSGLFNKINRQNIFGIGFVLGFIPCGLVYAAGAYAASTESILGGMLTMLVFGLGTFPAMMIVGLAAGSIRPELRSKLYAAASVLVMVLGIVTILRGIDALDIYKIYWLNW